MECRTYLKMMTKAETVDDFCFVHPGQTGPVIFEKNDFIPVKYSKFEKRGLFCPGGTKKNCQPCSKFEPKNFHWDLHMGLF